jgi:hypothetical protein
MNLVKSWLADVPWDLVIFQNASLCQAKNALHKPTSDGYEATKTLWETRHLETMSLMEAVDLCRKCHRMAPFCFYNGNTFAAIARSMVEPLGLPAAEAAILRSLAGHIVAGVATPEQIDSFRKFCERDE